MRIWGHGKRRSNVERALRQARPAPRRSLVNAIVGAVEPRGTRRRARFGVAAAVTVVTVAAVGATGGFSVAATSISTFGGSVAHSPVAASGGTHRFDAACDQYAQRPTVTRISPAVAAVGGVVTVTGSNFTGINAVVDVEVGNDPASFQIDSSTSLELTVPSGATSGNVTVSNCAGAALTTPALTVESAPSITNVNPATGGYGTPVTITGSGFLGTTSVTFNGKPDSGFTVDGDGQISAHVPTGAPAKAGSIVVTNGVDSSDPFAFTVEKASPTISKFAPGAAQTGAQAPAVQITGSNFVDVTSVRFTGSSTPAAFDVASKTKIDVTSIPADAETGPITVVTSIGSAVSKQSFTIVAATPEIDGFSPTAAKTGTTIKIEGSSLSGVDAVRFSDGSGDQTVAGTSVKALGDTAVSVKVPAGAVTGPVLVSREDGAQTATSGGSFVVETARPSATASPTEGGYGTDVTITADPGTTLDGVTAVAFNGKKDTSFTIAADGRTIDAHVPTGAAVKRVGSGAISLTNALGTSTTPFDVLSFGPTIKKLIGTLGKGDEAQAGDPITITGTNLDTVTSVRFAGGKSTSSFVWQDEDLLTVRVPDGATSGAVTVVNPYGAATSATSLTILAAPVVVAFTPAYGRSGTKVTIVGSGFAGTTGVYFGGAPAKFAMNKDGSLAATVPANASTGSIEIVVGRILSADSGNDEFTVVATKPTVTGFSPGSGAPGDTVTITGRQFVGPLTVKFGSKAATAVHVTSSTSLTAKVPDGAAGTVPVSVTNLAGTGSRSGVQVVSIIRNASPLAGVRDSTRVTLTGTNLTARGTPTVRFNGTTATVVSASASRIVVRVPGAATTGSIAVSTGAVTVTAPKAFTVIVPPVISSAPASGRYLSWVDIHGSGFTGTTWVRFGRAGARFTVVDDGLIRARVPLRSGAVQVAVHNAAGTATTAGFLSATR
jgi:hypothetical protein